MITEQLKHTAEIISKSIHSFFEDKCLQFSAAVSFYALFSLAPIILIAIHTAGFFVGDQVVVQKMNNIFTDFLGPRSTEGLMLLIENLRSEDQGLWSVILGVIILIFSATNLFILLKDSFNQVFSVRLKEGQGLIKAVKDRVVSLGVISLLGISLLISLILDSIVISFFNFMSARFEFLSLVFAGLGSNLLTLILILAGITLLYYTLPDVKIKWPDLLKGSLITAILLLLGKVLIGWIIGKSTLYDLTGASSSIIVLMLWVFYCSVILFFGIELVKQLSLSRDKKIKTNKYSIHLKKVEVPDEEN